jgi:VIT1/CCC1 family predicted Fe2+/Mn2+ transporter
MAQLWGQVPVTIRVVAASLKQTLALSLIITGIILFSTGSMKACGVISRKE